MTNFHDEHDNAAQAYRLREAFLAKETEAHRFVNDATQCRRFRVDAMARADQWADIRRAVVTRHPAAA